MSAGWGPEVCKLLQVWCQLLRLLLNRWLWVLPGASCHQPCHVRLQTALLLTVQQVTRAVLPGLQAYSHLMHGCSAAALGAAT